MLQSSHKTCSSSACDAAMWACISASDSLKVLHPEIGQECVSMMCLILCVLVVKFNGGWFMLLHQKVAVANPGGGGGGGGGGGWGGGDDDREGVYSDMMNL